LVAEGTRVMCVHTFGAVRAGEALRALFTIGASEARISALCAVVSGKALDASLAQLSGRAGVRALVAAGAFEAFRAAIALYPGPTRISTFSAVLSREATNALIAIGTSEAIVAAELTVIAGKLRVGTVQTQGASESTIYAVIAVRSVEYWVTAAIAVGPRETGVLAWCSTVTIHTAVAGAVGVG